MLFFLLCEWDEGVVCSFFPEMRVLGIRLMLLEEKKNCIADGSDYRFAEEARHMLRVVYLVGCLH